MKFRFDPYEPDAVIDVSIIRADSDGVPICPPVLKFTDEGTGETFTLTREQGWRLRDLINHM